MRLSLFVAAAAVLSASLAAHADSLVLDSVVGDTYTYGILVSPDSTETFSPGETITLTGLSGVTGASPGTKTTFSEAFTPTSVTSTEDLGLTLDNSNSTSYEFPDVFSLTSTAMVEGTVDFTLIGSTSVTGTVEGPVASAAVTPEPSSFVLLGTGLLGMVGVMKKRFA